MRAHIHASRDPRRELVVQVPLEGMCGSCGSRAVSSSGPSSEYSWAWRSARCSGTPAKQSSTVLPAGDTRTELRRLRGTGACDRQRVLDSPGPSALAPCRLPTVSAAVRDGPAASSGAVDVSHLPAEGPHQSGDETADPGCGLVQHGHGCVSPPRSVEGSAALAAPRPIKERSLHEPQQLMRARQQKRCWPVVTWR